MMELRKNKDKLKIGFKTFFIFLCFSLVIFISSCSEIKSPTPEPFIGENSPPPKQEFRWSNGKLPKSFDPARASASPETDIVRALYEGLVDVDSKNLKPVRAIATKWNHSEDFKTWTFELRQNAKWSNGEQITAEDFVHSWKRLTELGDKVPQRSLLKNIVGMDSENVLPVFADDENPEISKENESNDLLNQRLQLDINSNSSSNNAKQILESKSQTSSAENKNVANQNDAKNKKGVKFGVEAAGKFILKVHLIHPDTDFPLLVSHPIFRPVYGDGKEFETTELTSNIVTNGAFHLKTVAKEAITLERSENYWNKDAIKLEVVKFIPSENAEQALNAYREGKIDAVTNANFQPLALKLLKPFEKEFRQTTHSALNYYEFNFNEKPFDDSRVREALAISIDRERLTEDEMDGITEPALTFLPTDNTNKGLTQNVERARKLLSDAGFPKGENFPTIKLVVNRNNVQQKIARSVSQMWLKNLNIKTEVIVKDSAEIENYIQTGDFSLARRGVVLPTNNETSNMLSMFDKKKILPQKEENKETDSPELEKADENEILTETTSESELNLNETVENPQSSVQPDEGEVVLEEDVILTENQAMEQLPAIPLYFPTSFSLVKPYIQGFELNAFDATSLKNVQIDSNWQPQTSADTSNK